LDSPGKQCCLIKALQALCLAFLRLNCSMSLLSCYVFAGLRLHPLRVLHHALLVAGVVTPVQHR